MIRFNPEVTLGSLLTIMTMITLVIGAHFAIKSRVDILTAIVDEAKNSIERLNERLDRHEKIIFDLSSNLQRVIGQLRTRKDDQLSSS